MRIVIFATICAIFALNLFPLYADTNRNIKKNEKKLESIATKADSINAKLKNLGANINDKNAKIKELDKQIAKLSENIDENQKLYSEQEKVFKDYSAQFDALNRQLEALQKELIDTILRDMAIVMMLNAKEPMSEDSIIAEEILKNLSDNAKKDIEKLIIAQQRTKNDINTAKIRVDNAKKIITAQIQKRDILQTAKKEQQNLANKMNTELKAYNNELKKLDKERIGIQKILVDLNILKKQELQEQERKRKELLAQKEAKSQTAQNATAIAPLEVRQIGSSYRNVRTAQYTGAKTIPPLSKYKLETKYGPYFDPVYKMRVFNEFITLGVDAHSPVVAVLDGKVVFAKNTPVLKKVVILEHKNGIHTIYSYLDEIPRNISVNAQIKKGATIAFVEEKLHFEVTQKDKHIDPLQLIKVK